MSYVIFIRNPRTKVLSFIGTEGTIEEFDTEQEAEECADLISVCEAWGYEIVEVQ